MLKSLFIPILDNGMGLGRIGWSASMFVAALAGVFGKRHIEVTTQSYPYPDGNRNIASEDFLQSECSKILLIDTDVVFRPQHISYLLSSDLPVIGGIVPKKKLGLEYSISPLPDQPNPFAQANDVCEVECVCGAFLLIDREVFITLMKHPDVRLYMCADTNRMQHEFWKNTIGGHSDDFEFCRRYRSLGGQVWVDKRCTLLHDGNITYPIKGTWDDTKQGSEEQTQQAEDLGDGGAAKAIRERQRPVEKRAFRRSMGLQAID